MLKKIEELRKKPKAVKDMYAVYGAVLVTLLVGGFWVMSLPTKFASFESNNEIIKEDNRGGFARAAADIKEQVANSFGSLNSLKNVVDGEETFEDASLPEGTIDIESLLASSTRFKKADKATTSIQKVIKIATTSSQQIGVRATTTGN